MRWLIAPVLFLSYVSVMTIIITTIFLFELLNSSNKTRLLQKVMNNSYIEN